MIDCKKHLNSHKDKMHLSFVDGIKTFGINAISIFCLILISSIAYSQPFPPTTSTVGPPQAKEFNTGANSGVTALLNPSQLDLHWTASTVNISPGNPAQVIVAPPTGTPCFWSPPNTSYPNTWITLGGLGFGCPSDPADYSCLGTNVPDVYYTYTFSLPPTPAVPVFVIDWLVYADGWVNQIMVNGLPAWNSYYSTGTPPNHYQFAVPFKWCLWKPNINTIKIHVKNRNSSNPNCKRSALKVESWPVSSSAYPAISGPTLVCPSKPFTYTVPTGMNTYSWTSPVTWPPGTFYNGNMYNSLTSGTISGIISLQSGSIVVAASGGTNFNCYSSSAFYVTVPQSPTVTSTSSIICSGSCAVLTASGAQNYKWYAGTSIPFAFVPQVTVCPTQNTTYNVWATSNVGNCAISKSIFVPVAQPPILIINSSPTVICQGQGVSLWTGGNAPTFTWMPVNSSAGTIIDYPFQTTVYTLTGTSAAGCKTVKTKTIIVNPTPTLIATASPSVICGGNSSNLSASGATNYTWTPGNQNTPNITVSPIATTIYTVTGNFVAGCSSSKTLQLLINPAPSVTVSPPSICPGITNTLTATGGNSFTWTIYGNPSNTVFPNQNPLYLPALTNSIIIQVCGTGLNGCVKCVTMALTPGTPIPLTVSNITLCTSAFSCTNISVTSTLTSFTSTWNSPGTPSGSMVTVCPNLSTIYQVNATPTGTIGCPSSATLAVTLQTNCCGASTLGLTQLTSLGSTFANNSYLLDASMTLTSNTTFKDAEVWITPGVQITVPSGTILTLDHAHLFACSNVMWQGIVIQDGGAIHTPSSAVSPSNSMIEDAIVAIDLDNIQTQYIGGTSAIWIEGVIFNRNRIGIRISNSVPTVTSIALGINGCVFSSRNMPYTTYLNPPMSWPSSALTGLGLKAATNPTTTLFPPYGFTSMTQSNLKSPYAGQPGHIGIQIENIGDPANTVVGANLVTFGIYPPSSIVGDFNLFDGLGTGIEIIEASLRTNKVVFQSMQVYPVLIGTTTVMYGGNGINHIITSNRNAALQLNTAAGNASSSAFGGRFWDCVKGIYAENVYNLYVDHSVFRSLQNVVNWLNPNTVGAYGIQTNTNRFNHYIFDNEFNNVRYGFSLNTPSIPSNYDIGNGVVQGIYAEMLYLEKNYFGPEVLSSTPYSGGFPNTSEWMDEAIQVLTPNPSGWVSSTPTSWTITPSIIHNKIDRAYRGVHIEGMENFPLAVSGNSIYVEDDFTYGSSGNPFFGYGVGLMNTTDNKSILTNTISGIQSIPMSAISAIYAQRNFGNSSPNIHCNFTSNCNYGFHFDDHNNNTIWEGNHMCNEWAGLALTTGGVIGQQGGTFATGNGWEQAPAYPSCLDWGIFQPAGSGHQTWVENSDALNSPMYVENIIPYDYPIWNGSNNSFDYNQPLAINSPAGITQNPANVDCAQDNSATVPSWRTTTNQNGIDKNGTENETIIEDKIQIYPNPTNGLLYINFKEENVNTTITIININGQVEYYLITDSNKKYACDLSRLSPSIYILEINTGKELIRKKIIRTN